MATTGTDPALSSEQEDASLPPREPTKKKKKRNIVTPSYPPEVTTAYLVVRGAVLGVLGVDMNDTNVQVSLLQATFLKEQRHVGRFTVGLGKKYGCGQVPLVEDTKEQQELLRAIEVAANRILHESNDNADNASIQLYRTTQQEAVDLYGQGVLDGSHAKTSATDALTVAVVPNVIVCATPGAPFCKPSCIPRIIIEVDEDNRNRSSLIVCGKKARKAEITLQFSVPSDGSGEKASMVEYEPLPDASVAAFLQQSQVRMPEGRVWLEKQQQQQQDVEATRVELEQASLLQEAETTAATEDDMVVNAFEVKGKIDYDKLVDKFGSKLITDDLLQRLQQHCAKSGKPLHRFLRRQIFFSHRDLDAILDCLDQDIPMYLYTGRGPSSSSMHLGHLIPFLFTKWLQESLDIPLVIQMTDDEKFLFKGVYTEADGDNLNHYADLTMENARDILACGFDPEKTFIFSDLDYVGTMYPNIVRIWKAVTTNTVNGIFGFDGTSNIGKVAFPAIQAAPSFASSFPTVLNAGRDSKMACLIPCAIDQDPYFRMTRDVARKLVTKDHKLGGKPALIHSKFFPPLQGATGKMSSSDSNSAIFLTDSHQEIKDKINHYAFSGGQETKKLQEELGADLEVDVAYQWLRFFLEDDEELERIGTEYGSGKGEYWSTNKVKERLIVLLQDLVAEHQQRRATVTDEEVRKWMSERCIL